MASVGCMKNDGVPVEASVALIFLQMMPDLPTPIVTTRPLQVAMVSTASTKAWSRCSMIPRIAAASTSSTRRASASAGWTAVGASVIRADGNSMWGQASARPSREPLLRQKAVIQHGGHGDRDTGVFRETDDRAELRVQLRGLAFHDVALEGGRRCGGHRVIALPRLLDRIVAEIDAARFCQSDHFLEPGGDELAHLGDRAPGTDRDAGECADTAHHGDEEELRPHAVLDVRRHLRGDAGLLERGAQSLDALAVTVVELSEHDHGVEGGVADVARGDDEADDGAEASRDVFAADDGPEHVRCVDAI